MKFEFWHETNGMVTVRKERDGGCPEFSATFCDMDEAQNFVIRILVMEGSLPKEMKEELGL